MLSLRLSGHQGTRERIPGDQDIDEILAQLTLVEPPAQPVSPRKVLFRGERTGEISSYVAGWLVGEGIGVIVLDGANRFDPYIASFFARKALIPPERILKRIRIARAFTCYQMATLMGERLNSFLKEEEEKPWVIILGPLTTFLDEDVPEREVHPLFNRCLKKMEEMAMEGIPFLLFQSSGFSDSKRTYLTKRLFQFSNLTWRISLEDEGPRVILEKELTLPKSLSHLAIGHSMT